MIQAVLALLSLYETLFLIAAIIGVTYDFCRSTFGARLTVPNL